MNSTGKTDIVIVGAGAAGLMAAWELAKAGKKVTILEAQGRAGGRILPIEDKEFGYPAQGGAEFVHNEAPITRALMDEAGLGFIHEAEDGAVWSVRSGPLSPQTFFIQSNEILKEKLAALEENISVVEFLDTYLADAEHEALRNSIIKMIQGYEAADPHRVSALLLKNDWLGKKYQSDGWIKEGYGALLDFLIEKCEKTGVEIVCNEPVLVIESQEEGSVIVKTTKKHYEADKVVVTVSLPVLKDIIFIPDISEKLALVPKIGFGTVIKLLIAFKSRWWKQAANKDLSKLSFVLCNEDFEAWWTQYPVETNSLVGWMAGPSAEKNKNLSSEQLFEFALTSLSDVFSVTKDFLREEIKVWKIFNWYQNPYIRGAYSYTAMDTEDAREQIARPIDNKIFFAGEALYSGDDTATVEGALGSGKEVVKKILG